MKSLSASNRNRFATGLRHAVIVCSTPLVFGVGLAQAIDADTVQVATYNGWQAFEVITQGDDPVGDGYSHSMPGTFDGAGAWLVNPSTLQIQVNHEASDASISEVDVDLASFQDAITNMISSGSTRSVSFVRSARQAYDRWSSNGGSSWTNTSSASNTSFSRFCSGQAYAPNTFGTDRGFADQIYMTGEESSGGRLFALDSANRDFYQLSGVIGSAPGGIGGMSFDSWENAALIDTGETQHVAIVLSPDGGSQAMKLYIGLKGLDANGNPSSDFLARNGLAYGSWYYLNASYPSLGGTNTGFFDTSSSGALTSTKLEDIDTSPSRPNRLVLGDQDSGVFTLDFNLFFGAGFDAAASSFAIAKISNEGGSSGSLDSPDNVDWTASTTLNGVDYFDGIIFVNEDNSSGEIWQLSPDGSNQTRIGQTNVGAESTGIFDLSEFVGYAPGSILLTNNQGSPSSMSVLINPAATLISSPCGESPCNVEGSVSIAGTAKEASTLTAAVSDANGVSGSIAYAWSHSVNGIVGNAATYVPTSSDVGGTVTADASYIDDDGYAENVTSIPSEVIVAADEPEPELLTVTGFNPSTVPSAQATYGVTVSGSGFVDGASVSISGGSGPAPVFSSVTVVNSKTITATMSTKAGGPRRTRYWDITISNSDGSSAVLSNGLTVIP